MNKGTRIDLLSDEGGKQITVDSEGTTRGNGSAFRARQQHRPHATEFLFKKAGCRVDTRRLKRIGAHKLSQAVRAMCRRGDAGAHLMQYHGNVTVSELACALATGKATTHHRHALVCHIGLLCVSVNSSIVP